MTRKKIEIIELDSMATVAIHAPLWNTAANQLRRKIGQYTAVYVGDHCGTVKDSAGSMGIGGTIKTEQSPRSRQNSMIISHLIELLRRFPQESRVTGIHDEPPELLVHVDAEAWITTGENRHIIAVFGFDDPDDSMPWTRTTPQQERNQ